MESYTRLRGALRGVGLGPRQEHPAHGRLPQWRANHSSEKKGQGLKTCCPAQDWLPKLLPLARWQGANAFSAPLDCSGLPRPPARGDGLRSHGWHADEQRGSQPAMGDAPRKPIPSGGARDVAKGFAGAAIAPHRSGRSGGNGGSTGGQDLQGNSSQARCASFDNPARPSWQELAAPEELSAKKRGGKTVYLPGLVA